ncbi:MAG: DNA polymerase I [Holosporales bacterium]|jgi:DNA polymerase-1|nr:DNA polymerase I [Holosporales bacterium]
MKKLVLIDGSGFIYRAFYALPALTSKHDKTPVGAVYGFCNMVLSIVDAHEHDYIAVVFDAGKKTFRHDIYPQYKSNRAAVPEDLIPQFSMVRIACDILGIPNVEKNGVEADDLIASYANQAKRTGALTEIVSSDKDLIQLMDKDVNIYDPIKLSFLSNESVFEKYGIHPRQMIDFQALVGDTSDNIPGIAGIGPKTASALLQKFDSLDSIFMNLDQIPQSKLRERLNAHKDDAYISKKLSKLRTDVDLIKPIDSLVRQKIVPEAAKDFLGKHGFNSIMKRISKVAEQPSYPKILVKTATDLKSVSSYLKKAYESKFLSIILVSESAIQFSCEHSSCLSIPINVESEALNYQYSLQLPSSENRLNLDALKSVLAEYFAAPAVKKIGIDVKQWAHILGVSDFANCEDVAIMAYILRGPDNISLQSLLDEFLPQNNREDSAASLIIIFEALKQQLKENNLCHIYDEIEKPLIRILALMEQSGVLIDAPKVQQESTKLKLQIDELSQKIYAAAGQEFNIASPRQVAKILYQNSHDNRPIKSTNAFVLEKIAKENILGRLILEWRRLSKLKSTYADAFLKYADNSRIHTKFNMTATVTGRLSSKNPNLQNIPVRTQRGHFFREVIIAPRDGLLLSLDYSQIELRVLASLANISTMKQAFINKEDIHSITASEIFNTPQSQVTNEMRRRAKEINFGLIYGMQAYGLSERLEISRQEANEYVGLYFKQYPGIQEYVQSAIKFAEEHGYVETIMHRKCYINDIGASSVNLRSFAKRQAVNAIIQGSAADIVKLAMIKVHNLIESNKIKATLILQIHDELLFEIDQDISEDEIEAIKTSMEYAVDLNVPLDVECSKGLCWG